jgi:site-specific DNA recombinase
VRDKIAASKRKGIWVGGPVPLGYASINKKLIVIPEEAETVRLIFRRYLEVGSIRDLIQDLGRRGIRTKRQVGSNGQSRGGIRFGIGPLAHLLRNRFYIGKVVYRGKVHSGEHEPIVNQALFEAVQTKLTASATARQLRLKGSPAILAGRIFDDRGNRMTPTHTNKRGARYRYYVSHALLQKRNHVAGSVLRVPAAEIESVVLKALREHFGTNEDREQPTVADDRDRIDRQLDRIVVHADALEIHLAGPREHSREIRTDRSSNSEAGDAPPSIITVPWSAVAFAEVKGILHSPAARPVISSETRVAVLTAIGRARIWIDDLVQGRVSSFAEIAKRESKVERHIRLLTPLAFISPRMILAIVDGSAPADRTVTRLAQALPHSSAEQEQHIRSRTD